LIAADVATVLPAARLRGELRLPGDKSISHRALLFATLAAGESRITGAGDGADVRSTAGIMRALGARIQRLEPEADGETDPAGARDRNVGYLVRSPGADGLTAPDGPLDCGNSGTSLRLIAGMVAGLPMTCVLDGDASLRRRPVARIIEPLRAMGAELHARNDDSLPPLTVVGRTPLRAVDVATPVPSAQVKSAILLAALQASGTTTIVEPIKSRDHTEVMLAGFGCRLSAQGNVVTLAGGQSLVAQDVRIPGDISSAAFFLVAAATVPGSDIAIRNVGCNPTRDGIIEVLKRMGAAIELMNERSEAGERVADIRARGSALRGVEVEPELAARTIDEYPVLSVAAALAGGVTKFSGVKELRYKESDRIAAMTEGLRRLGVKVDEREDGMTIYGGGCLRGAAVRSFADHRVAMSFAVAALSSHGAIEIDDARCADISFPAFFDLMDQMRLQ
jgi:3-phosphoshikimate 1-carboxyvinyltransferase